MNKVDIRLDLIKIFAKKDIILKEDNWRGLENNNIKIEIEQAKQNIHFGDGYYDYYHISLETKSGYPTMKRRINNFKLEEKFINELISKTKEIITEDIKRKEVDYKKENKEKQLLKKLKEKLSGFKLSKKQYSDNIYIKTSYGDIEFYIAQEKIIIKFIEDFKNIDKAIEFINKIKE